jgi:hypothetical protein
MSLDDKLREKLSESAIILEVNRDVGPRKYELALGLFLDDAIAQIKQAFADEGYIEPSEVANWQRTVNVLTESLTRGMRLPVKQYVALDKKRQSAHNLMTGQEWYDRFKKGATDKYHKNSAIQMWNILEAAKRAAGLTE